jgi:hypothetical protein
MDEILLSLMFLARTFNSNLVLPGLRPLLTGLKPRSLGFDPNPRPFHMGFVGHALALGLCFRHQIGIYALGFIFIYTLYTPPITCPI